LLIFANGAAACRSFRSQAFGLSEENCVQAADM